VTDVDPEFLEVDEMLLRLIRDLPGSIDYLRRHAA
jgi:hypothetical protein